MEKVEGIKSVDFLIRASGNGVVNWNGTTPVRGLDGKELNNHMLPKLRGYNNETGKIKEENGYRYKKLATEINFKETPLYVSQNCIRHHLFKDQSSDMHFASKKGSNLDSKFLLMSISGLLRGYVIPSTQCKRKSALIMTDFVDELGNGNFEQFGNSGEKDSNSIYSKTTFGETKYNAKGSISIEDLQFISLDKKFDRESYVVKNEVEGHKLAKELTEFLKELDPLSNSKPLAEFGEYYRKGSIYRECESGILINQDGLKILIKIQLELIENLSIKQAKGWLQVESLELDYNNSSKMFRLEKNKMEVLEDLEDDFAVYYVKKGE